MKLSNISQMVVHISDKEASVGERLQSLLSDPIKNSKLPLGSDGVSVSRVSVEDFDECAHEDHNDCAVDARCTNTRGSYECSCNDGFHDLGGSDSPRGRVCSGKSSITLRDDTM